MGTILNNSQLVTALAETSPRLVNFVQRLNNKDDIVDWDFLDRNGFSKNGVYFEISESVRTMMAQIVDYEKGRNVDYTKEYAGLSAVYPFAGTKYSLKSAVVKDSSKIVSNVFGGKSYHNYGLAVDLIPCVTRWKMENVNGTGLTIENIYRYAHLDKLAEECGIEWGGTWTTLRDPWHFQDNAYKLPPSGDYNYNYDKNCSFAFIRDYNSGKFSNLDNTSGKTKTGNKIVKIFLGVLALGSLAFLAGKRR